MDKIQGEKFSQFIEDSRQCVCRRIVQLFKLSADDAEDIYQESAIALFNNINTGLDVSMEKFFSGIWYRQTLKHLRRQKRIVSYDQDESTPGGNNGKSISLRKIDEIVRTIPTGKGNLQPSVAPDEAYDLSQMKARVGKALDDMAKRCRQLLTKYYLEGYSWAELAVQYDMSNADSAKAAANRCRRRFGEKYKELEVYVKE